jgi:hypothetical protein
VIREITQITFPHADQHLHIPGKFRVHVHWLRQSGIRQTGELFLEHCQCSTVPMSRIREKPDFTLVGVNQHMSDIVTKQFAR